MLFPETLEGKAGAGQGRNPGEGQTDATMGSADLWAPVSVPGGKGWGGIRAARTKNGESGKERVPVKRSRGTSLSSFSPQAPASCSCSLGRTRSAAAGPDARGVPAQLMKLQLPHREVLPRLGRSGGGRTLLSVYVAACFPENTKK